MTDPTPQRPGYQHAPHYRLLLGCGAAAAVLAVVGSVVNFELGPDPKVPVPPGTSARPSGLPTSFPTDLPTALPTGFPTGPPSFPTQLPADVPTGAPDDPVRTS
ncbi:hypothetical protein [Streptomyces sp. NPDC007205]|uniref:hypothetical protein n=1 Tax=Streptomyces sp. NPDC007205 TaxID=3154316 RepID=UPI0033EF91C9